MDMRSVEGNGGGIEVVLAAEGIEVADIRSKKIDENPLLAGLCDQDVDLGDHNPWIAFLGEVIQRLGIDFWGEAGYRHQDLSKTTHRRSTLLQAGTPHRMRKVWNLRWSLRRVLHACPVSWCVTRVKKILWTTWLIIHVRLRFPYITVALSRRVLIGNLFRRRGYASGQQLSDAPPADAILSIPRPADEEGPSLHRFTVHTPPIPAVCAVVAV